MLTMMGTKFFQRRRRRQSLLLFVFLLFGLYLLASVSTWVQFHQSIATEIPPLQFRQQPDDKNNNPNGLQLSNQHPEDPREYLSSVDYYACCGLGHRLIRQSLAHYIARQRNFSLRVFWGWCGEEHQVEVFSHLFRPQSVEEVAHVTSKNIIIPFYNEISGFTQLVRKPLKPNDMSECPCQQEKIDSDLELYTSLRNRFRGSTIVNNFVDQYFTNATVLGIHVRAGNGEVGDFSRKGRGIENPEVWVEQVCKELEQFLSSQQQSRPLKDPPLLYIATDTPSMIGLFRNQLAPLNIKVVDLPQRRPEDGTGVLFGEAKGSPQAKHIFNKEGDHEDDSVKCLEGWEDTLTDMFILSHADVVIAAKPSSFSQALPMSLAFGRDKKDRKTSQVYCELIPQYQNTTTGWEEIAPIMKCFADYVEWCCQHSTWIKFSHKTPKGHERVISKEFIKFPNRATTTKDYPSKVREPDCKRPKRGRIGGGLKDKCIPHSWY